MQIKNFTKIQEKQNSLERRPQRRGSLDRLKIDEEVVNAAPQKQQHKEALFNIHQKLIDNFHDEFDWDANKNSTFLHSPPIAVLKSV